MKVSLLLALALFAAGCGGAKAPPVAGSTATADAGGSPALEYARCMRAHGVPSFPDPQPNGGFLFKVGAGMDSSSPSYAAAQATCSKFMGGITPGTATHPTTQWLTHMVKVAQCMRTHGLPGFPDPTTTIPHLPSGGGLISDIEGAVFSFPSSIDEQSPVFTRAAATCGFPMHNH
ncbi:MAG: hypothetical protein ACREUG_02770 [Steroidobacteraceae bacterium]